MIAALRFIRGLGEVSLDCEDREQLASISTYLDRLEALASDALGGFNLERVRERADDFARPCASPTTSGDCGTAQPGWAALPDHDRASARSQLRTIR